MCLHTYVQGTLCTRYIHYRKNKSSYFDEKTLYVHIMFYLRIEFFPGSFYRFDHFHILFHTWQHFTWNIYIFRIKFYIIHFGYYIEVSITYWTNLNVTSSSKVAKYLILQMGEFVSLKNVIKFVTNSLKFYKMVGGGGEGSWLCFIIIRKVYFYKVFLKNCI